MLLRSFSIGNLRLVVHWAIKSAPLLDVQDKFQYGVLGLWRAIEGWDWRRGYTFATYATPQIRQAIGRGIANDAYSIRLPVHVQEKMRSNDIHGEEDDKGSIQQARLVADGIYSVEDLQDWLELGSDDFDYRCTDPSEWIDERITNEALVRPALESLGDRERRILEKRAGMYGPPMILEELGLREGITRERVRQVEGHAEQAARSKLWSTYCELDPDRAVFQQALQEDPTLIEAAIAIRGPKGVARAARDFGVEASELSEALKRIRAASG